MTTARISSALCFVFSSEVIGCKDFCSSCHPNIYLVPLTSIRVRYSMIVLCDMLYRGRRRHLDPWADKDRLRHLLCLSSAMDGTDRESRAVLFHGMHHRLASSTNRITGRVLKVS